MQPVDLPSAFERLNEIGGALRFAVFSGADGDGDSALAAIATVLPDIDTAKLRSLGFRRIDDRTFYGDWYDAESDALLQMGTYTTEDGRTLVDPKLRDIDGVAITHGARAIPDSGAGGQFAYALSWTPYGLRARPREVQDLFCGIRDFILPAQLEHEILDWSSPRLPEASEYFAAGMEWWGVFLFTAYVPALRRLTVIVGSTTD